MFDKEAEKRKAKADKKPSRRTLPAERLDPLTEQVAADLFDVAWSWFSIHDLDTQAAWRMRKAFDTEGAKAMAKELFALHMLFDVLGQLSGPACEQIRAALESMKAGQDVKPIRLTLPKSRYEHFRRSLLKGLFNALGASVFVGDELKRVSFRLGDVLFSSPDDAPRTEQKG